MKAIIVKRARVRSMAVAILLCAIETVLAQPRSGLALNKNAFAFAAQLIKEKHFIADGKGAWSEHRPSAEQENEFIQQHGLSEFGKWYLGLNDEKPADTKGHYEFPYGDFKEVHRCGVLTAESRAGQYKHLDIENAAAHLHGMIDAKQSNMADSRS